ncbi:MAG: sialate O-acetylesterase [Casimicrobium sp.]
MSYFHLSSQHDQVAHSAPRGIPLDLGASLSRAPAKAFIRRLALCALVAVVSLLGLDRAAMAAELRVAAVFGEHMVVQRDVALPVWGWATPGESVRVSFRGRSAATMAATDGRWKVNLPAMEAGGPDSLVISGSTTITLNDVLVGDMWLCSGQSNMEWTVAQSQHASREIAAANQTNIRHLKLNHRASFRPQEDVEATGWRVATPAHVGEFSAVAYFFAREVQAATGVPIGLVNASWGGTHIETWMSPTQALQDASLEPWVRTLPADVTAHRAAKRARMQAVVDRWQGLQPANTTTETWSGTAVDDARWQQLVVPQYWESQGLPGFDGYVWFRRTVDLSADQAGAGATLQLGMIDDCDETWVNGQRVGGLCGWDTPRRYDLPTGMLRAGANSIAVRITDTGGGGGFHGDPANVLLQTATGRVSLAGPWRARVEAPLAADPKQVGAHANDLPTLAFNGMIHPLLPLPVRGVLWYHGEANVPRAAAYAPAFEGLIRDWRRLWKQPELPFYFVQLAAFLPVTKNDIQVSAWAELRDAQAQALTLLHSGMAIAIDIGDANDIHPRNKQEVGRRLALLALADTYGQKVSATAPALATLQEPTLATNKLSLKFMPSDDILTTRDGDAPRGFAIAGADQKFHVATARIERGDAGERVVVWSDAVPTPVAVRYAWVNNPEQANLVGRNGLPVAPFRTDRWPLSTANERFMP